MDHSLSRPARVVVFLGLCLTALTILYPLWFIVTASLRPADDYLRNPFGLPQTWTLDNFGRLLQEYGVGPAFLNSVAVVSAACLLALALAVLAGFALAKYPVPFSNGVLAVFVSVMLLPGPVLIIPIYLLLARVNLIGEYPGLILVYVATSLPFSVFFLTLSFRSLPVEVMEAARIDGAGFLRTLWSIAVPMGIPAIATVTVLQFLGMWNELIYAFILLPDSDKTLLTPALARIGDRFIQDQTLVSAGLLVTASVPIILLVVASRYIMKGLAAGYSR